MAQSVNLSLPEPSFEWPRWSSWGIFSLVWTIPGLVALSYYYLNQSVTGQEMSWPFALVSTLPNWYLWAAMTPLVIWLARKFPLDRFSWRKHVIAVHLPAMLGMILLHSLANLLLFFITGMPGHESLSSELYKIHFGTRVHANFLTYWTIIGAFYAFDYQRKLGAREQQAATLETRLAEAELRALKMQLHPHFLFNTLNSIAALVRKESNKTAIKMLVQLGDFLRLALENKGAQEIPLKQELDFLERYLDIEKIRFQERLLVNLETQHGVLGAYVPNMILQPLVENAIHHGIAPNAEAGRIDIRAKISDGNLKMEVADDGPGMEPGKKLREGGVGLANIRERLYNLYGDESEFTLKNGDEGGFLASITIPLSNEPILPQKLRG